MAKDYFAELKKQPYSVFIAPKPYSFDLNENMLRLIREEFNAEGVAAKLAEEIKGKPKGEVEKIGKRIFEEYGQNWMKRTMQLGEEYSDRTVEVVKESVDRQGNQFIIFPHIPQRFVEIAYLSIQQALKIPITLNNARELAYRMPKCTVFKAVKEKCGDEAASLMMCKNGCLKALETIAKDMELYTINEMTASTAKEGYCEFHMRKL